MVFVVRLTQDNWPQSLVVHFLMIMRNGLSWEYPLKNLFGMPWMYLTNCMIVKASWLLTNLPQTRKELRYGC